VTHIDITKGLSNLVYELSRLFGDRTNMEAEKFNIPLLSVSAVHDVELVGEGLTNAQ